MSKIFFIRHQAGGVLYEFPFSAPPTDAQIAPIIAREQQRHGTHHPKEAEDGSRKPYWTKIVDAELLGPTDIPKIGQIAKGPIVVNPTTVTGVGTVTPLAAGAVPLRKG